jgi:hypothetical protein
MLQIKCCYYLMKLFQTQNIFKYRNNMSFWDNIKYKIMIKNECWLKSCLEEKTENKSDWVLT